MILVCGPILPLLIENKLTWCWYCYPSCYWYALWHQWTRIDITCIVRVPIFECILHKSQTAHILPPHFFRALFEVYGFLVLILIRKSFEETGHDDHWINFLLQSKTWLFIECRNSPSYRLKDKCVGIKISKFQISGRVATERHMSTCIRIGTCHVVHVQ